MRRIVTALGLLVFFSICSADEIRPGYLSLTEQADGIFSVLWKQPQNKGAAPLATLLPDSCVDKSPKNNSTIRGAIIARWIISCPDGIKSKSLSIKNLKVSNTDVLLQIHWLDESSNSARLTPSQPVYTVPAQTSQSEVIVSYFLFGVEHILVGADHLLFVFALLLIVTNTRRLILTITSFTIAHSITLAVSTLSLFSLPQQPVEAAIAMSIMFLAAEIIHGQQGHPGAAARWPWLIAFTFGLLHGFGFAGALSELGLPQNAIPTALIFFNIGVEAGQLMFVGGVLLLGFILKKITQPMLVQQSRTVTVYTIGGFASFWMIERLAAF